MSEEKECPLSFPHKKICDENCAWFDEELKKCSIISRVEMLKKITKSIKSE